MEGAARRLKRGANAQMCLSSHINNSGAEMMATVGALGGWDPISGMNRCDKLPQVNVAGEMRVS